MTVSSVGMGMGMLGGAINGQGVSAQDIARLAGSMNGADSTAAADNLASATNKPAATSASQLQYPVMSDDEASDFVKRYSRGGYRGSYRSSL